MSQTSAQSTRPQVEYRRLGNSGLRVSVPIFGAMSLGSSKWGGRAESSWVLDEDKAVELLKAAWDRGITTFDTANMYSNGESERVIGRFLKKYDIPRNRVVILTKCFFSVHDNIEELTPMQPQLRDHRDYVNNCGLSRTAIFNQVEASLKRLDTPYIDLLQIHRLDPNTPIEETMRALHDLVATGKVRYIGSSAMRAWQFSDMNAVAERNGWTKFVSMQNEYSLLYREEEREMIPYCKAHGIGLIPYSPLHTGDLAKRTDEESLRRKASKGTPFESKFSKEDHEIVNRVEEVAKKHGWKMSEVALSWLDTKVTSPIVGCSTPQRLDEAVVRDKSLTEDEIKYLEQPYVPKIVRGHA